MIIPNVRYAVAVFAVAVALAVERMLDLYLVAAPVSLLLCAIMVSGWFGGLRGGLLAVAISLLAFDFMYVAPVKSFGVAADEIPRMTIFTLSAVFVGWLSAAQRTTAESLRSARDQLRQSVHELRKANETLKADEAERRRAEEELRQARADLTRVSRITTMGELTASLAHEVNQPIAAAVINANSVSRWLAAVPPDVEEARAAAARMVKDATRAADIINRVRLLFRKGESTTELVDVNSIIEEMTRLLRGEAAQHAVSTTLALALDLPTLVGDRIQLQQVVMNLMVNGIEAMKEVDTARELVVTSQREREDRVLVSVRDTGVGLPGEGDEIFRAFFTTKAQGTGMGLSISRSIIEAHGGRLWASNVSPRGACFHFTLPVPTERQRHALS